MQIDTSSTSLAALSNIWSTSGGTSQTGTSSNASSFGPASILSIMGGASTSDTYSQLASYAILNSTGAASTGSSQQLTETEVAALETAFSQIEDGLLDEAEATLDDVLLRNKTNAAAIHAMGLVEKTRGDLEAAETLFRRADYLAPDRGYGDDADDARLLQEDDETVVAYAAALGNNPDTQDRGISLLLSVTERSPGRSDAKLELGRALIGQGDLINGFNYLMTASSVGNEDDNLEVEAVAEELVELLPTAPQARRLLGRAQVKLGKYEEAIATLNTATDLSGTDIYHSSDLAAAHVGIGRELLDQGDISRALGQFREAKSLDGYNTDVAVALGEGHLAKADQLRSLGDLSGAITSYYDASNAFGSNAPDHLGRRAAASAFAAGLRVERQHLADGEDVNEEVLAFQAAYNLDPDNAAYKRRLADVRVRSGDQAVEDEEYLQAAGAYRRAYQLYPGSTEYRDKLVGAYKMRGDELMSEYKWSEAIEAYDDGYRVYTNNEEVKAGLASAYNARGADYIAKDNPLKALSDIKAALALDPDNEEILANYERVKAYDPDYEP